MIISKIETVRAYGTVRVPDNGIAVSGEMGKAFSGNSGMSLAARHGIASAGSYGMAIAGWHGEAQVGAGGTAIAGDHGKARAGDYGTAIAGVGGAACAGEWGKISIDWSPPTGRVRAIVGYVGEDGILPNVYYHVVDGKLVEK